MIVKCIKNKREDLPPELLKNYDYDVSRGQEIYMEIGTYFYVFGIDFNRGVPWYLILENDLDWPEPQSSGFFEIVDSSIPNDWHFCYGVDSEPWIIQKEWTNSLFYGDLLDEEEYAVKKFAKQKKIADDEIKKFLNLKQ